MQTIDSKGLVIQNQREGRRLPAGIACWTGALLLLFISAVPIHAQFGASLAGTVLDQTGSVISNATVTLTSDATKAALTSTTNATAHTISTSWRRASILLQLRLRGSRPTT